MDHVIRSTKNGLQPYQCKRSLAEDSIGEFYKVMYTTWVLLYRQLSIITWGHVSRRRWWLELVQEIRCNENEMLKHSWTITIFLTIDPIQAFISLLKRNPCLTCYTASITIVTLALIFTYKSVIQYSIRISTDNISSR